MVMAWSASPSLGSRGQSQGHKANHARFGRYPQSIQVQESLFRDRSVGPGDLVDVRLVECGQTELGV